jgi:Flp pilus assembly protein TadG
MLRRRSLPARKGVSAIEFALVAPIVFFLLLGVIQFARLLMSHNVLTAAAREGGRVASLPSTGATNTVVTAVNDRLQRGGINPSLVTVTVSPATLSSVSSGTQLRVTVSAPINEMAWIWAVAPPSANLTADVTYQRE